MEFNDAKKKRTKFNTKGQFFLYPANPRRPIEEEEEGKVWPMHWSATLFIRHKISGCNVSSF